MDRVIALYNFRVCLLQDSVRGLVTTEGAWLEQPHKIRQLRRQGVSRIHFIVLSQELSQIFDDNVRTLQCSKMTAFIVFCNNNISQSLCQTVSRKQQNARKLTMIKHQIPTPLYPSLRPRSRIPIETRISEWTLNPILLSYLERTKLCMLDVFVV